MSSRLFGFAFAARTPIRAAEEVVDHALLRGGGYICLTNVHVLMKAQDDARLAGALANAWRVYADGAPLAWLQRRGGQPGARRVAGTELLHEVVRLGLAPQLRHAFYGSSERVIHALRAELERRYPLLDIAAAESPPFLPTEDLLELSLDSLMGSNPHIVWCGLGAPKQELWMHAVAKRYPSVVFVGVGAAFEFVAGTERRAPEALQRAGLEWLFRLVKNPRRLGGRYLRTNARFVLRLATSRGGVFGA